MAAYSFTFRTRCVFIYSIIPLIGASCRAILIEFLFSCRTGSKQAARVCTSLAPRTALCRSCELPVLPPVTLAHRAVPFIGREKLRRVTLLRLLHSLNYVIRQQNTPPLGELSRASLAARGGGHSARHLSK